MELPTKPVFARVAVARDALAVSTLCREAIDELSGERGGKILVGTPDRGSSFGLDRELTMLATGGGEHDFTKRPFEWLIGIANGMPVGVCFVRATRQQDLMVASTKVLYVESQVRRLGVGKALLRLAGEWARSHGCVGLDVPALPGQRAAKVFLEDAGFKARLIVMHIPLNPIK